MRKEGKHLNQTIEPRMGRGSKFSKQKGVPSRLRCDVAPGFTGSLGVTWAHLRCAITCTKNSFTLFRLCKLKSFQKRGGREPQIRNRPLLIYWWRTESDRKKTPHAYIIAHFPLTFRFATLAAATRHPTSQGQGHLDWRSPPLAL